MHLKTGSLLILCLSQIAAALAGAGTQLSLRLEVSANHRFLVASDGQPFFYLGDTAWALFSCLNREEAAHYLGKLDFNMQQNGHKRNWPVYDKISNDYHRAPPKPTMDAEPSYEWHPVDFDLTKGRINPHDVRTFAYWEVFAGACGFTYGHYLVFPFSGGNRDAGSDAVTKGGWLGALDAPAALQMKHLKQLVLSRSYLDRVPDQQLLSDSFAVADHVRAACGRDYAFFYTRTGKAFTVRMGRIRGTTVKAQWYDPRDGTCTAIGVFPNSGTQCFTPPTSGAEMDWVLVLDDATKGSPSPGRPRLNR